ncbi:MAG: PAS domain S-box protein [Microcoleus vaginatus WJT46-NPBG5]|nr:PAS domain S-box protein [Microcoleus vaginatus WJT46-NPBG5]
MQLNKLSFNWPTIESAINRLPLRVASDTPVLDVLGLMSQSQQPEQVVLAEFNRQPLSRGIFTQADVLKLIAAGRNLAQVKLGEAIDQPAVTLTLTDHQDISTAVSLLHRHRVDKLPILDNSGALIGAITPETILQVVEGADLLKGVPVEAVMSRQIITAPMNAPVQKIAQLMIKHQVSWVAIASESESADMQPIPLGIITESDIVQAGVQLLDLATTPACALMRMPANILTPQDSLLAAYQQLQHRQPVFVTARENIQEILLGTVTAIDLLQIFEPAQTYKIVKISQPAGVQLQPKRIEVLLRRNNEFTKHLQQRVAHAQANFRQVQQESQKLKRQAQQTRMLECISKAIRKQVPLDDILQTTANQLQKALEASRCLIFWPDSRHQMVTCQMSETTAQPDSLAGTHCNFSGNYHPTLAQGEPLILPRIDDSLAPALQQSANECGIRALLIVPLIGQQSYLGEIALHQCEGERIWDSDEVRFVKSLADRCALAIEQVQLSEQVQTAQRDRQRVEKSLQESEAKYRSIFENAIEGIFQTTPDGSYISANPSLAGIYGYNSPAELIANLTDIGRQLYVDPARRDEFMALIQEDGSVSEFESQVYRADGSIIWISENAHAVRNAEGALLYCEGTVLNISKRKQAELALKEQQEFLRQVIDTNPNLIFVKDWEGKFTLVNQALANIYETTVEDLLGKKDADFNLNTAEVEEVLAADQQVMSALQPKIIAEETVSSPNGKVRWFQTIKTPLLSPDGQARHILAVCNDITERKQTEKALQESKQMLQLVMDNIPQLIFWKDRNSVYLGCNRNFARAAGVGTPEEIAGKTDYDLAWKKEESDWFRECDARVMETDTPEFHIIETQRQADGKESWADTNKIPLHDSAGNVVGIIGTYEDVTFIKQAEEALQKVNQALELRVQERTAELSETNEQLRREIAEKLQVEEALRKSEDRFRNLIETTSDWVWEIDENAVYTYASPKVRDLLGYEPEDVLGKTPFDLMPSEEAFRVSTIFGPLVATQQPLLCVENTNIHKDGRQVILETSGAPVFDAEGVFRGYRGMDRDITDRKRAEAALRESEERYRLMADHATDMIGRHTPEGVYLYTSPACRTLLGYEPEELVGHSAYEFFHPEDVPTIQTCQANILEQPDTYTVTYRIRRKDNRYIWFESTGRSVRNPDTDEVEALVTVSRDVTERKQAEEALRESELRLRLALKVAQMGTWDWNAEIGRITWSEKTESIFGFAPDTFPETWEAYFTRIHPEDREYLNEAISGSWEERKSYDVEHRILWPDGSLRWVAAKGHVLCHPTGRTVGMSGVVMDITERKQAEEALQRQLAAVEAAMDGIAILNSEGKYIYMNAAHVKIFGYDSVSQLAGKTWQEIYYPDEIKRFEVDILPGLWQKGNWQGEATGKKHNGTTFLADVSLTVIADGGLICVCRDLSERKQVEEILKVQERAIAASSNGIAISDARLPDTPLIYVNPAFERMTGYSAAEVIGKNCRFLQGRETNQVGLKEVRRALKEGKECSVILRNYRKDGSLFWNELSVAPIYDDRGNLTHFIGIETDITERKQAEEALQAAKAQLRAVLDAVPGFVSWISSDLQYLGVNRHLAAAVNLSPEAFAGQELGFFESGLAFGEFMRQFFAGSKLAANQVIDAQVNGSRRSYLIAAQKYQEGAAAVSVAIDITERQQAQEQLKVSLKEKEVLLKEIHHRVKNNLQIISSLLKLQSSYLKDIEAQTLFKDSYNRVRSMALIHEKLYRSSDLAKIDLADYIRNLLGNLFSSYGVSSQAIELKLKVDNISLDVDTAIPCGLIINELVSNSIKYAFTPGLRGKICVEFYLKRENEYILLISDNGVGLPSGFDLEQTDSLGLQLVFNLAEQLGGSINLNTDNGTKFKIKFEKINK